jgi:hypothetical protein
MVCAQKLHTGPELLTVDAFAGDANISKPKVTATAKVAT